MKRRKPGRQAEQFADKIIAFVEANPEIKKLLADFVWRQKVLDSTLDSIPHLAEFQMRKRIRDEAAKIIKQIRAETSS